jgi:hypothetical protein
MRKSRPSVPACYSPEESCGFCRVRWRSSESTPWSTPLLLLEVLGEEPDDDEDHERRDEPAHGASAGPSSAIGPPSGKLRSGGAGTVVPSMHADGRYLDGHTIRLHLKAALEALRLPPVTWYEATRHTGASHWVMAGNSIEKLRTIMGHSSVQVTERYAHLRPDAFGDADRAAIRVNLGTVDHGVATMAIGKGRDRASTVGTISNASNAVRGRGLEPPLLSEPEPKANGTVEKISSFVS